MQHVIMGTILVMTSILLVLGAILTAPKLERIGIRHSARYSFAAVCVTLAIYLGWIGTLFYGNELGPENYVLELWVVRIVLLVACVHFCWAVWKCDT